MAEWKYCTIGDLCDTISDTYKRNDNEVILINTSDVLDGEVLNHTPVANVNLKGQFKKTFKRDDILYSEIRPANKRFAFIDFDNTSKYIASTKLMVLRPRENVVLPRFLYAILKSKAVIDELQHLAETRSGTFPQITFSSELSPMEIMLPDLTTQKQIVSILSAIEGKIRLNTAINDNLEQQAQAIFKAWFVDFLPFGGVMPDDWRMGKLKEILSLKKNSIKAGTDIELPYLPIEKIPMNTFAVKEFCPNSEAKSSLITFNENDIIIGAMRVYFHRVIIAPCSGITRTTCFVLVPYDKNYLAYSLLLCNQNKSIDFAQRTSKGSTMPYAIWEGGLGDMDIIIPNYETITKFNNIIVPMLEKIKYSYFENQRLSALRDTLLPKLINGEIDVSAVKI